MITYGSHAALLTNNGYNITPLKRNSKRPFLSEWVKKENYNPPAKNYKNCGIGIVCGVGKQPVYAIDLDITDKSIIEYLQFEMSFIAKPHCYRIGNSPKTLLVYRSISGLRKRISYVYEAGKIERLGLGQQFVAFGIHPNLRRPYRWPGSSILEVPAKDLPVLKEEDIDIIFDIFHAYMHASGHTILRKENNIDSDPDYDPNNPLYIKDPLGTPTEDIIELLNNVDPDCGRDEWRNIGMAIHHETGGSEEGFEMWNGWSSGGTKYNESEMEYQWNSFGKYSGEPITLRSLIYLYQEKEEEKKSLFDKLEWSPSRFVDEPEPIPMVVEGMIPKGIVCLFYSAGGAGKSTIIMYLAMQIALATKYEMFFFNKVVNGGKVIILSAEDPDLILNRRYIGLLNEMNTIDKYTSLRNTIENNLSVIPTIGHAISFFKINTNTGILKPTIFYKEFLEKCKEIDNLQLIIIDTKTRFSPTEGLGNVAASQEVTLYELLAGSTGASVMLLHHTNKKSRDGSQDGIQAYRDATAIFDNTRASWFFRGVTNKEVVDFDIKAENRSNFFILENAKNNYIKRHDDILIERDGFKYEGRKILRNPSTKEAVKEEKRQALLERITAFMQRSKQSEFVQTEIVTYCSNEYQAGRRLVLQALKDAQEDGLINSSDYVRGKARKFYLTPEGATYNLQIE